MHRHPHPPSRQRERGFRWGESDVSLEVHHVNGDPSDNRLRNTIPLCRDCHRSPEMHR